MTDPRMTIDDLRRAVTEDDGVLPNGRAPGVGDLEWRAFLTALRDSRWRTTWDGEEITHWPDEVEDVRREDQRALRVEVATSILIRIFPGWGTDDIWFDFDRRELRDQAALDQFFAFVGLLGRATQRPVSLSHEGDDDGVFAVYDPGSDSVRWTHADRR